MNSAASRDRLVREMLAHLEPPMPLVDRHPDSRVAKFYSGRSVFITGATGFIGKALIEKLLRSCDGIRKIYVLVREKRGKDVRERLADLIKSQCFDRVREINCGSDRLLEEKLHAIKGDITEPELGVSEEDMRLLANECSIVFNSAATIRFVEPIDVAVRNNIYSVGQLVEFCNKLTRLEALIHLSTAYSNCHKRDKIHEVFYAPPMRGDQIQDSIEQLKAIQKHIFVHQWEEDTTVSSTATRTDSHSSSFTKYEESIDHEDKDEDKADGQCPAERTSCKLQRFFFEGRLRANRESPFSKDLLEEFTRVALWRSNRPNTYTFTKAISENYLLDKVRSRPDRYLGGNIPVAIVRPSIVGGAWREPIVGMVDNFNGPTGAILSLYTGALQAMPGMGGKVADLVPVDMVANMVLCAGWFLVEQATGRGTNLPLRTDHGVFLFNFVSGNRNPLHWYQVTDEIARLAYKYPSKFLVRLPSSYFICGGPLYDLYDLLNQKLPAYLVDLVRSRLLGQYMSSKTSAMATYSRVHQMTETLTSFTSNQWRFCDKNVRLLYEELPSSDKSTFPFDVASIDWPSYIRSYIIGSRIYTLKDEPENVREGLAMLKRRRIVHGATWITLALIFYYLILAGTQLDICKLIYGL